ncbi:cupin domain-containing protein [Streptomyces sp. AD2-2]|nr:cupin domain-containing protein [Streptomyces sp. AD2-2]
MTVDPLSDALAVADARSVFSGGFTAGGDWAIQLRGRDRLKVNAVVQGGCLLVRDGGEPLRLVEGDVVISDGGSRTPCAVGPASRRPTPRTSSWTRRPGWAGSGRATRWTWPACPGTST